MGRQLQDAGAFVAPPQLPPWAVRGMKTPYLVERVEPREETLTLSGYVGEGYGCVCLL